jgi:hypothetical protein
LALFFATAGSFVASDAHALEPIDIEIAPKAGGGTSPGNSEPSALGFGIGGRAGVQIRGLYGGVALVNYFGEGVDYYIDNAGPSKAYVSRHALVYGLEGGYGVKMGPLTLRAQLGVGDYAESVDISWTAGGPPTSYTSNSLYLEPGLMAMIALGSFLIGADANVLALPGRTELGGHSSPVDAAFTSHGQLGVKF